MDDVHYRGPRQHAHRPAAADRLWNLRSPAPQTSDFFMHGHFLYDGRLAGLVQKLKFL